MLKRPNLHFSFHTATTLTPSPRGSPASTIKHILNILFYFLLLLLLKHDILKQHKRATLIKSNTGLYIHCLNLVITSPADVLTHSGARSLDKELPWHISTSFKVRSAFNVYQSVGRVTSFKWTTRSCTNSWYLHIAYVDKSIAIYFTVSVSLNLHIMSIFKKKISYPNLMIVP